MKWNIILVLLGIELLLFGFAYAAIEITPSTVGVTNLYGGESLITQLHVKNTFGAAVYVLLFKDVVNTSHDYNGFNVSVTDNNFFLMPGQTKDVNLQILLAPNIYPEDYNIMLWASTDLETVGYPIYISTGGGGTVYKDKNVFIDRNRFVDRNVYINVPIEVNRYIDKNVYVDKNVFVDKNIYVDKIIGSPDDFRNGLLIGIIIVMALVGGGFAIYKLLKGGKTNGTTTITEQPKEVEQIQEHRNDTGNPID